ncbi:HAMP domain-containing sensor histidine kinase [Priestia megaterium]|uniref:HAMP domain-containing sensor histidine kinase n=1 Tax=Priestia megaterium TaxID=1404 RepID=UPI002E221E29|nr:HAMP domain-containing sensor histidine kinase [Priestia megaterium]MED4297806.1 HAMP domain-containing sensor histidine kinase [Priestia megaterium]
MVVSYKSVYTIFVRIYKSIIQDSEKGMTQEQINRLGETYFTTKEKGTGLGMTVSFSIIRGMNGSINETSDPQKGTCFSIKLPLYQKIGELNPNATYKGKISNKIKGISSLPIT